MSVINRALTEIADKKAPRQESSASQSNGPQKSILENDLLENSSTENIHPLKKAIVPHVRQSNKLAWAVGGFALSLGIGSWAVSQQEVLITELQEFSLPLSVSLVSTSSVSSSSVSSSSIATSIPTESDLVVSEEVIQTDITTKDHITSSPTVSLASTATIQLYSNDSKDNIDSKDSAVEKSNTEANDLVTSAKVIKEPEISTNKVTELDVIKSVKTTQVAADKKPISASSRNSKPSPVLAQVAVAPKKTQPGEMAIEQVEISPNTLSANAIERGKKALDSNELSEAIQEFENALKYQPNDDETRKRLTALYYGKKDIRRSIQVLQQGIRLNESSQELRIALAKILIKEGQAEAALSPLVYLPNNVNSDYLELRAALSQQVKNQTIATETYQILTQRAPDNARWWLGLAIQQERALEYQKAYHSYQAAISKVGVSKQTQAFIRERLTLLKDLQGE